MYPETNEARQIRAQIAQLGTALNEDRVSDDAYKQELRKLLDAYFVSLTRDADVMLQAMKDYTAQIESAHRQKKMSDKEYELHHLVMILVTYCQEDFCNRVYFE